MSIQELAESKKFYIIEQYESGRSSTSISRELNINSYYICKVLHENGVELRNKKLTTKQVDEIFPDALILFNSGMSIYKVSKETGINETTLARRLNDLGVDTSAKSTKREEPVVIHTQKIIEMYKSGLSTNEIAKIYDTKGSTIWNILNKNGIKCRSINTHSANYDYFEKIDSDEKAYITGLLFADGHVKTNTQVWGISLVDKEMIEEIVKRVEYTGKIHYKQETDKFDGYVCKPAYELSISSPKMKSDLIKLGCVPRKTLILKYPTEEQIPLEFRNAFIRGYMDGDGSVGFSISKNSKSPRFKVQFTSTLEMCEGMKEEILSRGLCSTGVNIHKANNYNDKNTYYLFISGENCVKFLDWCYEGSTIHLHRKWVKYQQLKEYFQYKHLLITPGGNKKGWLQRRKERLELESQKI